MKKIIFITLAMTCLSNLSRAQNGTIVFGPLVGDSAGVMVVENNQELTVPVWVRTSPGINIVGIHWPLASKNTYFASRDGINFDFLPFVGQEPGDSSWQSITVLPPNPFGDEYFNQGMLGIKDFPRTPYPGDGLATEGEWWQVAEYFVTLTGSNPTDTLFCDAFAAGFQQDNGGFVWADFALGELPPSSFQYKFACLRFASNVDPVWCPVETEFCGDIGATLCINLCGSDENLGDALHITQIQGGGTYTENTGGPGGYTAGTWCGRLPEGSHVLVFELNDNFGGVVPLELTINMREVTMDIQCVQSFPGGSATIPITLSTCEFRMGGMELLIGWNINYLTLHQIVPTGRIDDGNEYWNVNSEIPCDNCPGIRGARIVWIADISNGVFNPPAYAGDDPVLLVTFDIDESVEIGQEIPVEFYNRDFSSNTVSDSTGFNWFRPELSHGCVQIIDPEGYKGDPNMNGMFYEVGDALLVVRYLIYGSVVWIENGTTDDAVQAISADLNNNNMVDVPDLIRFINIINGRIEPPKLDPVAGIAEIVIEENDDVVNIEMVSPLDVGGVLLEIDHTGMDIGGPSAHDMDMAFRDQEGKLRVLIYSMDGNTIPPGNSTILSIPVISNNGGSLSITEVSSADLYGRTLETAVSAASPLPARYDVLPNYPNPFNAMTVIGLALPQASHVKVEVFDLLGRSVGILFDDNLPAGRHDVTWDASSQTSGVYFYRVLAGEFRQTRKMLLIK